MTKQLVESKSSPVNWDDLYDVEDDYDRSFAPDSLPPYYEGEFWETRDSGDIL